MIRKNSVRLNVVMWICLLAFGILATYVPHHHHHGRICVDITDSHPSESSGDDDCHLNKIDIKFYKATDIQKIFGFDCPSSAQLSDFEFRPPIALHDISSPARGADFRELYKCRSQKLRGSPLFS